MTGIVPHGVAVPVRWIAERSRSAAERSRGRAERFAPANLLRVHRNVEAEMRWDEHSIARGTFRALAEPRRLLPIALVCGMMLVLQVRANPSREPLALPLGILMCAVFVAVAPLSWRVLFPEERAPKAVLGRLALYAALGAGMIGVVGLAVPRWLRMEPTLLTMHSSLLVCCSLFWVGGWGLGRDIELEESLRLERRRAEQLAREADHAQLLAVRAHLDPHFLFNTLNAIAEWCREDAAVAERAILELSSILRAVLAGVKQASWSLASELTLVRDLFALHQLRDAGLFTLEWDVPSPVPDVSVPPMIVLPLAENAVKHGPAAGHRGVIRCAIVVTDARVVVTMDNPGAYRGPRPGSDGLPTVQRRLALAYGKDASLRIEELPGDAGTSRTRAALDLPRRAARSA
jgi:hypothetical protein